MQQNVAEVVSQGLQLVKEVVEAEGEHAERAVGLVAALDVHGHAPEVVPEQVAPRDVQPQVCVFLDSRMVVEAELQIQRIDIHNTGQSSTNHWDLPSGYFTCSVSGPL